MEFDYQKWNNMLDLNAIKETDMRNLSIAISDANTL